MADKGGPQIMTPGKGDALSVRNVTYTNEDRKQDLKTFRERKDAQDRIKDERFAAIRERRRNKPSPGGSGAGINIEVTSD